MTNQDQMMNEIDEINLMIKVLPKKWPTRNSKNTDMINQVIQRTNTLKDTYQDTVQQGTIEGMLFQILVSTVDDKIWDRDYRS